ncbi:MAG: hypothetical protein WC934_11660 [Acidithiobacillus sp.]|jgi:hypothetical protein|uniref:hypothetical protein n=1 Tax=Acidithiobacillus sp. TaxID=1872118 RepID=UPI00355E5ED3
MFDTCPCGLKIIEVKKYGIKTYLHVADKKTCKYINRYCKANILTNKLSSLAIDNLNLKQMYAFSNSDNVMEFLIDLLQEKDYDNLENIFNNYQKIIIKEHDALQKMFGNVLYDNLNALKIYSKGLNNYRMNYHPQHKMLSLKDRYIFTTSSKVSDNIKDQLSKINKLSSHFKRSD